MARSLLAEDGIDMLRQLSLILGPGSDLSADILELLNKFTSPPGTDSANKGNCFETGTSIEKSNQNETYHKYTMSLTTHDLKYIEFTMLLSRSGSSPNPGIR